MHQRIVCCINETTNHHINDLDDDEEISVVKMPLSVAVEKVMTGEINHAASMIGILLLDKLRIQKKL